jgi:cytidyltransferase-like protein
VVDNTNTRLVVPLSIAFSVGVIMKVAYTVGRFQPPTIGHKSLIETVKASAEKAYVFVSSTVTPPVKNPLESKDKLPILKHLVEGVEFVDTATCEPKCGGAIAAFYHLIDLGHDAKDIKLVVGDDHINDFGPNAPMWDVKAKDGKPAHRFGPGGEVPAGKPLPPANFVFVKSAKRNPDLEVKDADNMSGTKARQYAKLGRIEDFYIAVGYSESDDRTDAKVVYDKIAGNTGPPAKRVRRGGEEPVPEVLTSADAEFEYPSGGRMRGRKTLRRCRKCGLLKMDS